MIFLSGTTFNFPLIFNVLVQREGRKTTLPTLVSMTGLSESQIQSAINNARRNPVHKHQIEVLKPGREWRFKSDVNAGGGYPKPDEVVKEVEMGSTHIWKTVFAALASNEGKVSSKELLAQLASTDERSISPHQVSQAMLTIMRQPELHGKIETLWKGRAWKYLGNAADAPTPPNTTKSSESKVSVPIRGSVLRYFSLKPGETLFLNDIADDLGFTKKQVQSAMWNLLNENEAVKNDFVVVQPSYAWRYQPNSVKPETNGHTPEVLERVPSTSYPVATSLPNAVVHTQAGPLVAPPSAPRPLPVPPQAEPAAERTATVTTTRVFEQVGELAGGELLLKDEADKFYRASAL